MIFGGMALGLAVIAMLSWGLGDFLIQKSSRQIGDWQTLFIITLFGTIILLPFVYRSLPTVFSHAPDAYILLASAIFLTAAAIFEIESFRRGKMSVVEPMVPFEIPTAAILAFVLLNDRLTALQLALIISLIVGLFLVSFRGKFISMKYLIEKGVYLGLFGAMLMGVADFLLGWGSRATDALTANFVVNVVMAGISGIVLLMSGRMPKTIRAVSRHRALALAMSLSDNIGWIGYAFAMTIIPIAVATGLSEASCIIAVLMGIFVNRERLQNHQKVGLIVALGSAITLAFVTTG